MNYVALHSKAVRPPVSDLFIRESLLQRFTAGRVQCNVCERRCLLVPGGIGWCRTRENRRGRLFTLTYGAISLLAANAIEKKPFYHFHPGTVALTAGSWSCNFGCPWCQNWDISKVPPPPYCDYLAPQRFVDLVAKRNCQGTSISFNEPTMSLEWSLEVFRLARSRGFYNTFVTNGYMTPEALGLLVEAGLDAMNVDIKGGAEVGRRYCKMVDMERVWSICELAHSMGVHLEITSLIVPGISDSDRLLYDIAERVVCLGRDIPWHLSRYHPAYHFSAPPTDVSVLEHAWEIGKKAGLQFVYIGNVPGHRYDNTYCPDCGALLIRRVGCEILEDAMSGDRCPHCSRTIAGVWN